MYIPKSTKTFIRNKIARHHGCISNMTTKNVKHALGIEPGAAVSKRSGHSHYTTYKPFTFHWNNIITHIWDPLTWTRLEREHEKSHVGFVDFPCSRRLTTVPSQSSPLPIATLHNRNGSWCHLPVAPALTSLAGARSQPAAHHTSTKVSFSFVYLKSIPSLSLVFPPFHSPLL